MLRNISIVALILSLIIFEQRVSSSVLPPLTEEAPLFVFSPPTVLNAWDNNINCCAVTITGYKKKIILTDADMATVVLRLNKYMLMT